MSKEQHLSSLHLSQDNSSPSPKQKDSVVDLQNFEDPEEKLLALAQILK